MTVVDHGGVRYDENTNWRDLLRKVKDAGERGADFIPAYVPPWAGQNFLDTGYVDDLEGRLGMLAKAMAGTSMQLQLADAALELLENGLATSDAGAVRIARALPYRLASDALPRLLALWGRLADRLSAADRARLLADLLEAGPHQHEVQQIAIAELDTPDCPGAILVWAARHMAPWLADNLGNIRPGVDQPLDLLILEAPPEHRHRLLSAIAALGEAQVNALLEQRLGPYLTTKQRETLLAELSTHPAFAARL